MSKMTEEIRKNEYECSGHNLGFIPNMEEGIFFHSFLKKGMDTQLKRLWMIIFSLDRTNLVGIVVEGSEDDYNQVLHNCLDLRSLVGVKQSNGDILLGGGKSTCLLNREVVELKAFDTF